MKKSVIIVISFLLIVGGIIANYSSKFIFASWGEYLYWGSLSAIIIPSAYLIVQGLQLDRSLSKITKLSYDVLKGNFDIKIPNFQQKSAQELSQTIVQIKSNLQRATNFAVEIGEGNLDSEVEGNLEDDVLIASLDNMRGKLKNLNEEEEKRNWSVEGQAKFGDILRDNINNLNNLCREVIINMVKYLDCNQGGIYIINNDEESGEKYIELMAFYAYEREKFLKKRIEWGDGLVGQCILESDIIYKDEVPGNYVNITSGLGEATPRSILLVPLKLNNEVYGVIEMASFKKIEKFRIDFVESVGESIASTISSAKMGENTKKLLDDSKKNNEILVAKEHEMKEIQRELSENMKEIEAQKTRSESLVNAVNKTNASIEFDMDGKILNANSLFLNVMGYQLEDLVGKHENAIIPVNERDSPGYTMMWGSLQNGSFFSGEFKRVNAAGDDVWLNGTYNPVSDGDGTPYKVIKFALFTTDEKERELQIRGRINAIKSSIPIIEVKPDLTIKTLNDLLKGFLRYKRLELKKLTFADMVDFSYDGGMNEKMLRTKLKGAEGFQTTFKITNKVGDTRYFLSSFSPIINLKGDVDLFMGILNDVTEQVNLELNLKRQLEAERTKAAFGSEYNEDNEKITHQFESILAELSSGDVNIETMLQNDTLPIIISNTQSEIKKSSNQARIIFNMRNDLIITKTISDLIAFDNEETESKIKGFISEGRVYQDTFLIKPEGKDTIEYVILLAPVFDEGQLHSALIFLKV